MQWDPEHYLTFDEQRTRPARDLLSRVPHTTVEGVVDLGCGPGNSTALLQRFIIDNLFYSGIPALLL